MSACSDNLQERIRRAVDRIPSAHRLSPREDETFKSRDEVFRRLQNYVFTQGFAVIIYTNDNKRNILVVHCNRHQKNTRNTRRLTKC